MGGWGHKCCCSANSAVLKKKCKNNFRRNAVRVQPPSEGLWRRTRAADRHTHTHTPAFCVDSNRNTSISRWTSLSLGGTLGWYLDNAGRHGRQGRGTVRTSRPHGSRSIVRNHKVPPDRDQTLRPLKAEPLH